MSTEQGKEQIQDNRSAEERANDYADAIMGGGSSSPRPAAAAAPKPAQDDSELGGDPPAATKPVAAKPAAAKPADTSDADDADDQPDEDDQPGADDDDAGDGADEDADDGEDADDDEDEGSILRRALAGKAKKKPADAVTLPKAVIQALEAKGIKDPEKVFSELPKLRKAAEQATEFGKKYDALSGFIDTMPEDLQAAFLAHKNGNNWREVVNVTAESKSIDFSKDFEDNDPVALAKWAGEELTKSDIQEYEDEDGDPVVKRAVKATLRSIERAFDFEKRSHSESIKAQAQMSEAKKASSQKALKGAADYLVSMIPEAKPLVPKLMEKFGTKEGILSIFFNEDETAKEDILVSAWVAANKATLFEQEVSSAKKMASEEAELKVLGKLPAKPRQRAAGSNGGSGDLDASKKKVDRYVAGLLG